MTKSKPQIKIVNLETGEEIIRDANADEIAQLELDAENQTAKRNAELAKETQRQAVLDRLGLTADEAKLILG
jgi:hypothetical protein